MAPVLEVRRDDPALARVAEHEPRALADGEVRFAVERFGLTANNVTYALFGDEMRYWTFFAASEDGWGRVPAWGYAVAVESRSRAVSEGLRVYGFVPMGAELVLAPTRADEGGLDDASEHRATLPAAYNAYRRADGTDDVGMVLRPLFLTSVLLARSLRGTPRAILTSASTKTALGTAYLLRSAGIEVVGITRRPEDVEPLGVYDALVGYEAIEELERRPVTLVDFAGPGRVRAALHRHLGDALEASVAVGATHRELGRMGEPLPGPRPTFFFAPDHLGGGLDPAASASLRELLRWASEWVAVERRAGPGPVLAAWRDVVAGALRPATLLSLSLR